MISFTGASISSGFGSQMILTTQIEGVRDGKIVDSQRADSEDLFALVDMLTEEVKADLGFLSKPGEIDAPASLATSLAFSRSITLFFPLRFLCALCFLPCLQKK